MHIRGLQLSTLGKLLAGSFSRKDSCPRHVYICVADHYEPMAQQAPLHMQKSRVKRWCDEYPNSIAGISDSRGAPPHHTFFYPIEEINFDLNLVSDIAQLCGEQGSHTASLEIHLHHGKGVEGSELTSEGLRALIERRKRELVNLGALGLNDQGQTTYGFIHGNWALDNSHPTGMYCGLNDELTVLRETGCYADFTMPSAPAHAQTRTINSIYYATDDPARPMSHDRGLAAAVGARPLENSLLMIQGPLFLDWSRRKAGLLPCLENGEIHGSFVPTMKRFNVWQRAGVAVVGRPDWLFVKLHTHGGVDRNASMLLGEPMRRFHCDLASLAALDERFKYYYVSARQMADLVHQAEAGKDVPTF